MEDNCINEIISALWGHRGRFHNSIIKPPIIILLMIEGLMGGLLR